MFVFGAAGLAYRLATALSALMQCCALHTATIAAAALPIENRDAPCSAVRSTPNGSYLLVFCVWHWHQSRKGLRR